MAGLNKGPVVGLVRKPQWRCLIPLIAFAEAEGEMGRMTRTWHYLPDGEPFAIAGIWRATAEWGDAYSMVMADGCQAMAAIHDRMPVVLPQDDWSTWTEGGPAAAFALCQPWRAELMIERTEEPWAKRHADKPSMDQAYLEGKADAIAVAMVTDDARGAIAAFLDRGTPVFNGR